MILKPTPSHNGNYLWIPEGIPDNVVPGLDSILTYIRNKYATLTALQHTITNVSNTRKMKYNIQTEINNIAISNVSNGSIELHYDTTHTDCMFQENVINNHGTFITQQHYCTYQRKITLNQISDY